MDGHAENAPDSLSDLASFLSDTPDVESEQEELEADTEESTEEIDTDDEETDGQEESKDDESDDEDAEDTPAPDRKLKVTVKGEDGTEQEIEVDESELVKGYQRQADYTRKTQELAQREHQAVEILKAKHDEFAQEYLTKAEASRAAIVQLAGLRSPEEMAQLAQTDPAAWVAENQRQQSIYSVLSQLDQQIATERQAIEQRNQQQIQQARAEMFQRSWAELQKDGIDRDRLAKAYQDVSKTYGFTQEELGQVLDHRQVRVMLDALAYRQLKEQKPAVQKKVSEAPKLPSKNNPTPQKRKDVQLEKRFQGGRAKLNDLAAYLR
jgi:hypothetical protein